MHTLVVYLLRIQIIYHFWAVNVVEFHLLKSLNEVNDGIVIPLYYIFKKSIKGVLSLAWMDTTITVAVITNCHKVHKTAFSIFCLAITLGNNLKIANLKPLLK